MHLSKKALKVKSSSTLEISAMSKELRAKGVDVISFGAGEPDFDTPEHVKKAAIRAIEEGFTKYTDTSGIFELREAICQKLLRENGLAYTPEQIVVSNGAKHSLHNVFAAIIDPGDEVLIPAPYWLSYPEMVSLAGGVPVFLYTKQEDGFVVTKEQFEKALSPRTRAILINSPCNPTGVVYTREQLRMVADFAIQHSLFVISDEIYECLAYDSEERPVSIAALGQEIYDSTIVVNGLSKSHAMTGWRMGYTASSPALAKAMANIQSHSTSNISSITQKAACAALADGDDSVRQMRAAFKERRDYIYERVSALPYVSALKPQGAFYIFVNVEALCGKAWRGKTLQNTAEIGRLLIEEYQVAVVPGADFGYVNYIRLSYATSLADIQKGMDRIAAFLAEVR